MRYDVPLVVLAGGRATRLGALAQHVPKLLLPIGAQPFAFYQLGQFDRWGFTHIVYCVDHLKDPIIHILGNGSKWGLTITYAVDDPPHAGTGGALVGALAYVGKRFFLTYGDTFLTCPKSTLDGMTYSRQSVVMGIYPGQPANVRYEEGKIRAYDAQPRADWTHLDYGLSFWHRRALEPWRTVKPPFALGRIWQDLIARHQLDRYEIAEPFYEIGSPESLTVTGRYLETRAYI